MDEANEKTCMCVLCKKEGTPVMFTVRGTDDGAYTGMVLVKGTILCDEDAGSFDTAF
jgi:hypothetical protein